MVESPRARLRTFLVAAFSDSLDSLRRFVTDYFEEADGVIPWSQGVEKQADALIDWFKAEQRINEVWPVLKAKRKRRRVEIEEIESTWERATRPDGELQAWLTRYASDLTQLAEKLRAKPTWLADLELVDVSVRERSIGEAGTGRLVGPLERALETVQPKVVLVGDGGAGKTTLLIRVAAAMAKYALEHQSAPLPLYMRLNFFDAEERALDGLLEELARSSRLNPQMLRDILRGERPCCLLLDGLNEVRREFRGSCISAIEKLASTLGPHRCIITSRVTADVDELVRRVAPATILEMVPLTEPQIRAVLGRRGLTSVADHLGPRLAELARTPFLVGAIITICEGVDREEVPIIVPQIYRTLIDDYIFTRRELQKPDDVRPTTYDYQRVKRPLLAQLALRMLHKGLTRIPEDLDLLGTIHTQLQELSAAYLGKVVVMPKEPDSTKFLDEVVLNGILTRGGGTLEFWNESVLDFYAGIGLSSLPAAKIAALVPPLVWRRIEVGYDELPVPGAFTEAIAMHVGLAADSCELLSLMDERHPLVAARCVGAAGLHETPSGRALLQQWSALLCDRRPLRRWVACQCLLRVGNVDENTGERLVDLALSDPEMFVRQVAMHALSGCGRVQPVTRLVAALIAHEGTAPFSDPGVNLWRLRSTQVVRFLLERWSAPTTTDRDRMRIESLLATMDPDFVADALTRINEPAAEVALRALPEWNYIGFQPSRMIREREKARIASEGFHRKHRERLYQATVVELQQLLEAGVEDERRIALELLAERRALTVDDMFEVLRRDPSEQVRARAEAALFELPADVWCSRWEELMSDTAWTVRFHAPIEFEEDLGYTELTDRWISELESHGISAKKLRCSPAKHGWLLGPVSASKDYENDVYHVINTGSQLAVMGASLRPRLALLGARLGERAMPALERFFEENPPYAQAALIEAWSLIGTDAAIERLAEHLEGEPLDLRVVAAVAASRHPSARALLLKTLEATACQDMEGGVDVEYRIRELTHMLVDLAAIDELHRLVGTMLDSPDGDRHIVAAHILLAHGTKTEQPFEDLAMRACGDANPRVREVGMKLLATTSDITAREILLRACVNEPVRDVWTTACESFRRACTDEDLLRLRGSRHAPDRNSRARVIGALALVRDDTVIPDLQEALRDPEGEVRVVAAEGLQNLGEVLSGPTLDGLTTAVRIAPST